MGMTLGLFEPCNPKDVVKCKNHKDSSYVANNGIIITSNIEHIDNDQIEVQGKGWNHPKRGKWFSCTWIY